MEKKCSKCNQTKKIEKFVKDKRCKNGRRGYCYDCDNLYWKNYYKKHPEYFNKRHTPKTDKNIWLKTNYGITLDDYNRMFKEQDGKCAICGKPQIELNHSLHVDHNHKTDRVRGLLCKYCNFRISVLEDIYFKKLADEYFKKYE